jgi:Rieske 2Fe-2S family protein
MSPRSEMLDLLASRKKFFSLPQPFYNDAALYELDLKGIWEQHWIFAGPECQIVEPGAYFTLTIGRSSVIVLRDRTHTIRAFHNTCRHRGSKLCEAEQGRLSSIVCPYHQWTYDFTGKLRHAGRMHEEFDTTDFGLVPVHVETVAGTIYVCLADNPPDFSEYKATLERFLAPHDLANAKLAHVAHLVEKGNWKLVMENSRECFHCATGHPELARSFITEYNSAELSEVAGVESLWERCEAMGLPYGDSGRRPGRNFRISRMPLLDGAVSITMDGKPAVGKLLGDIPSGDIGSVRWPHFPSTFNHVLGDYAFFFRMLPTGPEETYVTAYWLVDRKAQEGRDYDLSNLVKVWDETNLQDRDLVERNQRGVNSVGYRPGPYSQKAEVGVIAFVEWYCDTMTKFLGGKRRKIARVA